MVKEIVKSAGNTYMLTLPDEMIGKTVEVIAFEINAGQVSFPLNAEENLIDIQKRYSRYPSVEHKTFKFNRDEANDRYN